MLKSLHIVEGICRACPRGESSLVQAVQLVNDAIAYCRDRAISRLMFNATGLTGIPIPSLVDRFLMAEEWAQEAESMVVIVLVVHEEYIHPEKFGVKVAADFGLTLNVYTSEKEALQWLSSAGAPTQRLGWL